MAQRPRESQRVNAELPLRLENNASGVTRNISPTGVYFVIGDKLEAGQQIRFTLEFGEQAGGVLTLECVGEVVRVEQSAGRFGVAAKVVESRLERRSPDAVRKEPSATA